MAVAAAVSKSLIDTGNCTYFESGTLVTIREDSVRCRIRCKHVSTQEATLPTLPQMLQTLEDAGRGQVGQRWVRLGSGGGAGVKQRQLGSGVWGWWGREGTEDPT